MPIEIKELHIKINVDNDADSTVHGNNAHTGRESIVEECVEQVMQILVNLKER